MMGRMTTTTLRLAAALLASSALAACGGAGTTQCQAIPVTAVAPPSLIGPVSGSTGVSTTGTNVVVSYDPPSGALHLVAQNTGAIILGGPFMPATGMVSTVPGAVVSALPTLAPHTTYTVFVDAVYPTVRCPIGPSGPVSYNVGTFTTQ